VDALLGGLDRLIAKKRDLKQAAMQQLLTGQTRLPGFHGEWEAVEFGDVAVIRNAKVVASSTPDGTPCVELEHIDQGTGRLLTSAEATGLGSKYSFRKGDVLFGRLRAYLRKYWLAAFDAVCSTEIWPLLARDGRLDGSFLYWVVQTNDFVNAASLSYGTHMPRSDWSVLKKLALRLPPLPEQTTIAAVLSDMDAELAALEARRDKTRDLKQAMMQELLTGKTRLVPAGAAHA
jgi:type I restriction enzyme S subunit